MSLGTVTHLTPVTAADPLTGRPVTKLTDDGVRSWYPYFTQPVLHGQRLLVSREVAGRVQAHLLDLTSGQLVQISDLPNGVAGHNSTWLPGREVVCVCSGQQVYRIDLATFQAEVIHTVNEGYRASILSPSFDGQTVTFAVAEVLQTNTFTGFQYSDFYERLFRRPSCLIFRVEVDSAKSSCLWGEREWISHVNVSPTEPNWVVFCHEGPWEQVQRLWTLNAATHQATPILDRGRYVSRSGHETFLDDGRLLVQFSQRMTPTAKDWVHYNVVTDVLEHEARFYRFPGGMPSHIQANHVGTRFVGDCCRLPDVPQGQGVLAVIDHGDDEMCHLTPLCRHDTSWQDQPSHPHPVFTLDDRQILFNSDRGGSVGVYRVDVPE
ncbi:MAG: hypothetical protein IT204_06605 [Fimbriimonadaceae bacterium]|nr:hypothetical protein [Fimbriimonadaceae bacterium]